MKKANIFGLIIAAAFAIILVSCQKDPEPGGTAVEKMAGQWYIRVNGTSKYYSITTYNTSENSSTSMWVQASGLRDSVLNVNSVAIPGIKGKVTVDLPNQTFSANPSTNVASNSATVPSFVIANGKILTNAAKGPVSRTPADSIYFEMTISGKTYKVSGFHRTGFMEEDPAALNALYHL